MGIRNAYTNNLSENREVSKKTLTNISSQGDMSKVERIKEALESGEYKINLQALSEKIADELL
jgi:anti-sigma28 factor (negative regulator of flagellin synthesis)